MKRRLKAFALCVAFGFSAGNVQARSTASIIARNFLPFAAGMALIGAANSLAYPMSMYPTSFPQIYSQPGNMNPYYSQIDALNMQMWGMPQMPGMYPQQPYGYGYGGYQNPWGAPWAYGGAMPSNFPPTPMPVSSGMTGQSPFTNTLGTTTTNGIATPNMGGGSPSLQSRIPH
jgi:hypothetical protein